MNAFNFFLEDASRHSTVAAGNFYCALKADLQRGEKQNDSPRGKLQLTRESHGSSQVYKFRSILLVLVNSVENSFVVILIMNSCSEGLLMNLGVPT